MLVPRPDLSQTHLLLGRRLAALRPGEDVALTAALTIYLSRLNRLRTELGGSYGASGRIDTSADGGHLEVTIAVDASLTQAALRTVVRSLVDARNIVLPETWGRSLRSGQIQGAAATAHTSQEHVVAAADLFLRGLPPN